MKVFISQPMKGRSEADIRNVRNMAATMADIFCGEFEEETGSLACLGCGYEHSCGAHGCAILREAEKIHQRARVLFVGQRDGAEGGRRTVRMTCDPAVVGQRLRIIRKSLGFTGQNLADAAGLSAYTIFALELGRGLPNLYTVVRICEVLGITPNDLVCGDIVEMEG